MAASSTNKEYATSEQLAYAQVLDWGMKIGFVMVVCTFALYVLGGVPPHIPVEQVPQYWSMPVNKYLQAANVHTGWSWLGLIGKGDFMNFLGIAFLSAVTIGCYLRILPMLIRGGDKIFSFIAILEVLVLVLAASGVLVAGH